MQTLVIIVAVMFSLNAEARLESAVYNDFYQSLKAGDESSAELNAYYFLRNFKGSKSIDVAIDLATIYQRQSRYDEAIVWLKDLEKEKKLSSEQAAKISYLLVSLYENTGNKAAAEVHKSLLSRKYAETKWGKRVVQE